MGTELCLECGFLKSESGHSLCDIDSETDRDFPLNDEMYLWRADAQRFIDQGTQAMMDGPDWPTTFAARVVWLIDEMDRILRSPLEPGVIKG